MLTLVIPDSHNKGPWVEQFIQKLNTQYNYNEIIWMGDYFDSYGDGPFEAGKTARWLKKSLEDPKRIHLPGNHDLPHIAFREEYWCPGCTPQKVKVIREENINWSKFKAAHYSQGYVFSHAGFDESFIGRLSAEESVAYANEEFKKVLKKEYSPLFRYGARMGERQVGGITWLDWHAEFIPVPQFKQIVGHTKGQTIKYSGVGDYCIDTALTYLIHIEDETLFKIDLWRGLEKTRI